MKRPVFVPANKMGSRHETAVVLVGTAREFDVPQDDILSTSHGYRITERLADVLYNEGVLTKTSGNRAAKKNSKKERA